jgi:superfamily II DNA/RNA helicase
MYQTKNVKSSFSFKRKTYRGNSVGDSNFGFRKSGNFRSANSGFRPRHGRNEQIDISKYIQRSVPIDTTGGYSADNSFQDFGFNNELQINLDKKGYRQPTAIQDQAIKPILDGHDLIGLANTGTGKTAVFLLPLIEKVYKNRYENVLIIAPTRELAIQIDNEFREFSVGMRLYSAICVGGTSINKQIYCLKRKPNFVIGTPGRLKDLSSRGLVKFNTFKNIVLDEVDRMLDMGFINEITEILNSLPNDRQALFFSATMPEKIKNLTKKFLSDPITVAVKTGDTAKNILQDVVRVRDKTEKFDKLKELLNQPELSKVLIFTETKREVEKLALDLSACGYKSLSIHGNKRQSQRERSLTAFRNNSCQVLVATDVAARGLDIDNITHVINYTVPQTYDDYIHRIGRTGRGSKSGQALTFIN